MTDVEQPRASSFLETAALGSLLLAMVATPLATARFAHNPGFLLTLKATLSALLVVPGAAVLILGAPTLRKARAGDGLLAAWLTIGALATAGSFALAPAVSRLVEMITLAAAYFIASRASDRAMLRSFFSWALLPTATAIAAYSLAQQHGWNPLHLVAEGEDQTSATFLNRNLLAGFLAFCLPIGLEQVRSERRWAASVPALLSCGLLTTALFFTVTRGAILGALVSFLAWLIAAPRRETGRRISLAVFVPWIVALAAVLAFQRQQTREFVREGKSVRERVILWHIACDMFRERPLLGWGPGNYELKSGDFKAGYLGRPENRGTVDLAKVAHDDLLQLSAEMGIPGALLWACLGLAVLRRGWAARRNGDAAGVAIAAGALAVFIHGAVHWSLNDPTVSLLFFAALGTIAPASTPGDPLGPRVSKGIKLGVALCAAVALLHSLRTLASRALFERASAAEDSSEALWALEASHGLDRDFAPALARRALWLASAGYPSDGLKLLDEAIAVDPYNEGYLAEQGRLFALKGALASARKDLTDALRLNPNFTPAYRVLAQVEKDDGHADEAARLLREAAALERAQREAK